MIHATYHIPRFYRLDQSLFRLPTYDQHLYLIKLLTTLLFNQPKTLQNGRATVRCNFARLRRHPAPLLRLQPERQPTSQPHSSGSQESACRRAPPSAAATHYANSQQRQRQVDPHSSGKHGSGRRKPRATMHELDASLKKRIAVPRHQHGRARDAGRVRFACAYHP